jgi:hypothetical protein
MTVRTNSNIKIASDNNKIMFRYVINAGLEIVIKRLLLVTIRNFRRSIYRNKDDLRATFEGYFDNSVGNTFNAFD